MKELTAKEVDTIKRRCDMARPGPWCSYVEGRDHTSGSSFIMVGEGESRVEDINISGVSEADQDFIANARQDVPKLIAEINRLQKLL